MSFPKQMDSLVEYEPPIEVNTQEELEKLKAYGRQIGKKTGEDIIRSILAPKEWDQEGKHFVSFVSPNKASRDDVSHL
jgi:dynein light intermediate chain